VLKAPIRKIGGYGYFVQYREATATEAWSLYGFSNGVDSEVELGSVGIQDSHADLVVIQALDGPIRFD